jgi:hypothetical protein
MICANARDRNAYDRVFAGKGRTRSKSLAFAVPDLATADDLFIMTPPARQLASAFWPGDLAMILPWRDVEFGHAHESERHEVAVNLIAGTTTRTGLTVHAELDQADYQKGIKVTKQEFGSIPLVPHKFHGERNHTIRKPTQG